MREVVQWFDARSVVVGRADPLAPAKALTAILTQVALHLPHDAELEEGLPGFGWLLTPPLITVDMIQDQQRVQLAFLPECLRKLLE